MCSGKWPCALNEEPAGADLICEQGDNITAVKDGMVSVFIYTFSFHLYFKWRGLDYKSVTWELDNFLSSIHGANLIKEYENKPCKPKVLRLLISCYLTFRLLKLAIPRYLT